MANEDWEKTVRRIEEARLGAGANLDLFNFQIDNLPPEVADLTGLQYLDLGCTQMTDTGLAHIAGLTGLQELHLNLTQITDTGLSHIAGLTDMKRLSIGGTQITDASLPLISGMTGLQNLDLGGTQITDLRPLLALPLLTEGPWEQLGAGIHLGSVPALNHVAIANKDREEQRKALVEHLRTLPPWPEPLPQDIPAKPSSSNALPTPEQDSSLRLIWGKNGFDFLAAKAERDPIADAALDELRQLLETLLRKGNAHDDLYGRAQKALALLDTDPPDALKLHIQYQALMRLHDGADKRQAKFDDETLGTLDSLRDVVPGITLTNPAVLTLIERQEANRLAARIGIDPAREQALLKLVADQHAPFSPEVRDTAEAAADLRLDDRLAGTRSVLSRNALVAAVAAAGLTTAAGGIISAEAHLLFRWLISNPTVFEALAASMGDSVYWWVRTNLAKIQDLLERQRDPD